MSVRTKLAFAVRERPRQTLAKIHEAKLLGLYVHRDLTKPKEGNLKFPLSPVASRFYRDVSALRVAGMIELTGCRSLKVGEEITGFRAFVRITPSGLEYLQNS